MVILKTLAAESGGSSWHGPSIALAGGNIRRAVVNSTSEFHYVTASSPGILRLDG